VAGALCFDGINDHVDVLSYGAINVGNTDFTLDAWIKLNPGSGNDVLIDKRVESGGQIRGYSLFLSSGKIGLQLADGTWANYLSQAQVPIDGSWHHVAVSVTRTHPNGGVFYLDGQPAGPSFNPTQHSGSLSTAAPFRIGGRSALASSGPISAVFHGCVDEVEAFQRALNADEALSLYRAGSYGKCP
jgi:serine/threonine-protein kinase